MESQRSRSRSPIRRTPSMADGTSQRYSQSPSKSRSDRQPSSGYGGSQGNNVLFVKNLPKTWNFVDIKKFILANTKSEIIAKNLGYVTICNDNIGECVINFYKPEACQIAKEELTGKEAGGKKIFVCFDTKSQEKKYPKKNLNTDQFGLRNFRPQPQDTKTTIFRKPIPVPASLSLETYGLNKNFLHSLAIDPPLDNKIVITNLDRIVDESKLRAIFSHAGQILHVELVKQDFPRLTGKIEFDHPVEAVQAISMFHNQKLYTRAMNVQMDNKQNTFLPEGLQSFGPGLGANGTPLKGIRNVVEIEPIKKMIVEQADMLKTMSQNLTSSNQPIQMPPNSMELKNPAQIGPLVPATPLTVIHNPVAALNPNPVNPNTLFSLTNALNPLHMIQGLLQQSAGNDGQAVLNALQTVQTMNHNVSGFGQTAMQNQSEWNSQSEPQHITNARPNVHSDPGRSTMEANYNHFDRTHNYDIKIKPFNEQIERENFMESRLPRYKDANEDEKHVKPSDMLVFKNLPSTVTLQSLSTKMREVGELKFAEMTGQGRAIVRFLNVRDAERCVQLFDRSKVDGDIIEVRYF